MLLLMHGLLLRAACRVTHRHLYGLSVAACFMFWEGLITGAMKRKLLAVDISTAEVTVADCATSLNRVAPVFVACSDCTPEVGKVCACGDYVPPLPPR